MCGRPSALASGVHDLPIAGADQFVIRGGPAGIDALTDAALETAFMRAFRAPRGFRLASWLATVGDAGAIAVAGTRPRRDREPCGDRQPGPRRAMLALLVGNAQT